jgi:transposase-like protein
VQLLKGSRVAKAFVAEMALTDQDEDDLPSPAASAPDGGWTANPGERQAQGEAPEMHPLTLTERLRRGIAQVAEPAGARLAEARQWIGRLASHLKVPDIVPRQAAPPSRPLAGAAPHPAHPAGAPSLRLAASQPEPQPDPDAPPALPFDPEQTKARVQHILKFLPPKGDIELPANLESLAKLLSLPPPTDDFATNDLLHDCYPRGTRNCKSRVLLAVAHNLTRNFGKPGRLPISAGKAWSMLDAGLFADELASQLELIAGFILDWQTKEKSFLILEFSEIELVEYLFENLHPKRHGSLLIKVMDFKALSHRRIGLIRRIPARVRRVVQQVGQAHPDGARQYVEDTMMLLHRMAQPQNFIAVVNAAQAVLGEVEKIAAQLAQPLAPPPGQGGLTLGPLAPPPAAAAPAPAPAAPAAPQPPQPELHAVMRGLSNPAPEPAALSAAPLADAEPKPPRTAQAPMVTAKRRFTKKQKIAAVMRVLHGEDLAWVAVSSGTTPDLLRRWRDNFLDGGTQALAQPKAKERDAHEPSIDELKNQLQSLIATVEALSSQMAGNKGAKQTMALPAPDEHEDERPRRKKRGPTLALPAPPPSPGPTEDS